MRNAINNNPKVQAGVIVILLVLGVLMFMRMSGGGPKPGSGPPAGTVTTGAATTGTGAGAVTTDDGASTAAAPTSGDPATATAAAPAALPTVPAAAATTVTPKALVPGPGLPADITRAFARGDAIVLLIVKDGAIDDDLVRDSVNNLSASGVSVFVSPASDIARYSRITQGVGVNRVPALVAIRSHKAGGDAPEAFVIYGFRTAQGVVQAARDALYGGREDIPYHPG